MKGEDLPNVSHLREYPDAAYHKPTGKLWWELREGDPNSRGATGSRARMASWLFWNMEIGGTFTTKQLRRELQDDHEHFQRRQRELKKIGWKYITSKNVPDLGDVCILQEKGWWPGANEPKPAEDLIHANVRRQVFERDGRCCVICGRAAGEPQPDGSTTVLTVGHVVPSSHGGTATLGNLQTECSQCNETMRANTGAYANPLSIVEMVKDLRLSERKELFEWIELGSRQRSKVEDVYQQYRLGSPAVKSAVESTLEDLFDWERQSKRARRRT